MSDYGKTLTISASIFVIVALLLYALLQFAQAFEIAKAEANSPAPVTAEQKRHARTKAAYELCFYGNSAECALLQGWCANSPTWYGCDQIPKSGVR